MAGFFADPSAEELVELEDGTRIYLLREMDAGIQEDINDEIIRVKIRNEQTKQDDTDASIRSGNLYMVQRMVKRIEFADGKTMTAPIGMSTFRRMSRATYTLLVDRIGELNAPLSQIRRSQSEAIDLVME
jgi:hypothetical protein